MLAIINVPCAVCVCELWMSMSCVSCVNISGTFRTGGESIPELPSPLLPSKEASWTGVNAPHSPPNLRLTLPPRPHLPGSSPALSTYQTTRMELWPGAGTLLLLLFLLLLLLPLWFCSPSAKYFFKMAFYNGWILFLAVLAIPVLPSRGPACREQQ